MSTTIEKELETYREKLPTLLAEEGKFVLIHDGEVAGTFDTYAHALSEGCKRFKLEPFLVKQIQQIERSPSISEDLSDFGTVQSEEGSFVFGEIIDNSPIVDSIFTDTSTNPKLTSTAVTNGQLVRNS
jgi:hypothetical protein